MITGRQFRAARALLEWSAEDVARETGLTRVTVSKIESETVKAHPASLQAILTTFDRNGVEFLPDEGVRIRKNSLRVFSGKAGYRDLLDHIYETMKRGGRIRQFNFGDATYLSYAESYADEHLKRMARIEDLDARVLASADDINLDATYCKYRVLDKAYKDLAPYYIFKDSVVFSTHEAAYKKELLCVDSTILAERFATQFDVFWNKASAPKRRTADKK